VAARVAVQYNSNLSINIQKKLLALSILAFTGCVSTAPPPPEPAAVECKADEFKGVGVGESESAALADAHSALARQINSSVNVTVERAISQRISNGKENLNSEYESRTVIESSLPNAHDARIAGRSKRSVTVCMSKANAAKGFIERQRLIADSLRLASNMTLTSERPKQKNEAWRKTQRLYNNFMRIQYLLEGWEVESPYSAEEVYSKAREDYSSYCQAKLHWNPEKKNLYSDMAFASLSQNVKIEKSPCKSRGISLAYKGTQPDCSMKFGLNACSYAPELSLRACDGTEYLQLKNEAMGAHQRQDFALEKLKDNLKSDEFWNQWIQEIKQWSPQCE